MRIALNAALALTIVWSASAARAEEGAEKLVGSYTITSGKRGEKDVPKDHLQGSVRIARDTITTTDKRDKEVYVIRYSLEGSEQPYKIMMTVTRASRPEAANMKARGLIKVEGKTATLIYDIGGSDYPTGFEPKKETQNLFIMERSASR